ncbi:MAG: response regulator [Prochloraceae cyanobacterium]
MPPRVNIQILLLDDEPDFFDTVKDLLQNRIDSGRYILDYAENCNQAWEKIEEEPPDLLLLDIRLPDSDGFKFLKQLKEREIEIKVIIVSGHVNKSNLFGAIEEEKVSKFLPKDFKEDDLENTIEELFTSRQKKAKKAGLRYISELADQLSERQKYKLIISLASHLSINLLRDLQNQLSTFFGEAQNRENQLKKEREKKEKEEQERQKKDEQRRKEGKVPLSFLENCYIEVKDDRYVVLRWKKNKPGGGEQLKSRSIKKKDLEDPEAREILRRRTRKKIADSTLEKIFRHYDTQND